MVHIAAWLSTRDEGKPVREILLTDTKAEKIESPSEIMSLDERIDAYPLFTLDPD